jgi:hypothetical protein
MACDCNYTSGYGDKTCFKCGASFDALPEGHAPLDKERFAHDIILRWCRSKPRGMGDPCMRSRDSRYTAHTSIKMVINVSSDGPRIAIARTWQGVERQLRAKGHDLEGLSERTDQSKKEVSHFRAERSLNRRRFGISYRR